MTAVDYVLIAVIAFSTLISLVRGFVKEVISIGSWMLAIWLAVVFSPHLSSELPVTISSPPARFALAFVLLLLLGFLVGALFGGLFRQFIKTTGLSGLDKLLGLIFGCIRGGLVIVVVVFIAGLTPLPQYDWWKESVLLIYFQAVAVWIQSDFPDIWQKNFQ